MNGDPKPFFKRSEFWLTALAGLSGALIPVAHSGPLTIGTATPAVLPILLQLLGIGLPVASYNIGRGIAKSGTGN